MILCLMSDETWRNFQERGVYSPPSLAEEGFVHASTENQIERVAAKHYAQYDCVWIVEIDEMKTDAEVVFEDLYNLNEKYPHIYGPLPLKAVKRTLLFPRNEKGAFVVPSEL